MYSYIKGTLVQATPFFAVIDNTGMGYKIFIPTSVFSKLPQLNEEALLHISFVVREISQTLYGFITPQDRDLFEALLNVTGVGPKIAMCLISHLSGHELHHAITNHDITTISKVPGIGKKTAERLIMEMRDKIGTLVPVDPAEYAVHTQSDPRAQQISDAMGALINLGYTQMSAQKAIKKTLKDIPDAIDLSELITGALKNL